MFCPQCGSSIPEGQSNCPKCGPSSQTVNPSDIIVEQSSANTAEPKQQISSNIPLTEGETILWHRESTHGIIHKEVATEDAVTNKRCLKYDVQNKQVVAQVGIDKMPEVVIMNIHRVNDSLGGGVFLSPRMLGLPIGLYGGPRRGNMNVFGDVSLMVNGSLIMTIENVKDPQGVRQLIQALKRAHLGPLGRMWAAQRMGRPFQRFGRQAGTPDIE
jgi:RNA polymerase subunit RPABC4/transcription elongation factor Spt4